MPSLVNIGSEISFGAPPFCATIFFGVQYKSCSSVRLSVRPPGFWCVGGFCWFLFEFIFFNMKWLVFGLNFNIAWLKQLLFNKYVRTWIARHFLKQPNQRTNDPRRIFKDNICPWYFFGRRENEQRPQTDRSYFEIIVYLNDLLDINTPLWLVWG